MHPRESRALFGEVRHPNSSGGSTSVYSPTSSDDEGSYDGSSSDGGSPDQHAYADFPPSASASHSRHRQSRRHLTEARSAPVRRQTSHHSTDREDLDPRPHRASRRHPADRQHSRNHRRTPSQHHTSSESASTVASADEFHYSHHGGHPRAGYPNNGYRAGPAPSHGGYPPPMTAPAGYPDQYLPNQALVPLRHIDPYGYPAAANPFSPQGPQQNPFSPISSPDTSSYFGGDVGPPPAHMMHPQRHPSYAPSMPYGSEIMALQPQHPGMPPYGYGYPGPQAHPGWGPPREASPSAPDEAQSAQIDRLEALIKGQQDAVLKQQKEALAKQQQAADEEARKAMEEEKKAKALEFATLKELIQKRVAEEDATKKTKLSEIDELKAMIKKREAERVAVENAWKEEKAAIEAAKKAAAEKAEQDKKKKEEIAAASLKAKEEAEKKAEEAAKKAKDEHDKKLAEIEKAKEESEKKKKELEEQIKKSKPPPDTELPPIRFRDALQRKFTFPWAVCKTWKGMEALIKQAFAHIDVIGDHVLQQHYDLIGPDGQIILPQVWDVMVKPDWEITMNLWPMPEEKKMEEPPLLPPDFAAHLGAMHPGWPLHSDPKKKPKKADFKKKKPSPEDFVVNVGPIDPAAMMSGGFGIPIPPSAPKKPKKPTKKPTTLANWLAGQPAKRK